MGGYMEQVMKEIMDMVMLELWRRLSITGGGGHVGSYGRYSGGDGTVMVTDMNVMIGMEDLAMDDRMMAHMEDTVVVRMEGVTIFFPMFFGFNCLCLIVFNYIFCWFNCFLGFIV
ncbi:MAG: hypothetical protein GY695_20095 [Aestuariibacter sp.]|nr:hypothetical protein [Aestuariibacter sp.]